MDPKVPTCEHKRKIEVVFDPEAQEKELSNVLYRTKKVAAYARVSTEQDAQQSSYEAQIEYYTEYIQSKPEWEFVGVYSDEGITGTSYKKRDGFNQMVKDAKAGKIDLILTKSISRFARNTVDSLTITRDLKAHNVEVFFEKENISSMDAQAELIFTIMSSVAQEESRSISENVRWGKQRSMEAGKFSLAWSCFLGYTKGPDGLPVIVEEEAEIVRRIYKMFLVGHTFHSIARELTKDGIKTPRGKNQWRPETVRSILTNEKYKGAARLQKTFVADFLTKKVIVNTGQRKQLYITDSHDAIISEKEFEQVQQEIAKRCARQGRYYDSPFTGKIKCGFCGNFYGHRIWHQDRASRVEGWICINRYKKDIECHAGRITEDEIKKAFLIVWNRLSAKRMNFTKDYEEEVLNKICDDSELKQRINTLLVEKDELLSKVESLVEDNAKRPQPPRDYNERLKALTKAINEKKLEISDARSTYADWKAREGRIRMFMDCLKKSSSVNKEFDISAWYSLTDYVEAIPHVLKFHLNDGTTETVEL